MVADVYSRRPKVGKTLMVVDRAFYLPEFHSISIYGTTNIYLIDTYILHNYILSSPYIIFSEFGEKIHILTYLENEFHRECVYFLPTLIFSQSWHFPSDNTEMWSVKQHPTYSSVKGIHKKQFIFCSAPLQVVMSSNMKFQKF